MGALLTKPEIDREAMEAATIHRIAVGEGELWA